MGSHRRKVIAAFFSSVLVVCWLREFQRGDTRWLEGGLQRQLPHERQLHALAPHDATNTADLSKQEVRARNVFFCCVIAVAFLALVILSFVAVLYRSRKLMFGSYLCIDCEKANKKYRTEDAMPLLGEGADSYDTIPSHDSDQQKAERRHVADAMADIHTRDLNEKNKIEKRLAEQDPQKAAAAHKKLEDKSKKKREEKENWKNCRFWTILVLFVLFMIACLAIPYAQSGTASCHRGFFWEMHMIFFSLFVLTKLTELYLYAFDPSIQGELDWFNFSLKFLPSFFSYSDGYLDSTSIVIACACSKDYPRAKILSWTMRISYTLGVVMFQWLYIGQRALRDKSHASLAKLVHMEVVASCTKIPDDDQDALDTWYYCSMARTFGEDLPQALQQTIYVCTVQTNYIMIMSICLSLLAGLKAMWDRIKDAVILSAAYERFMRLYGVEEKMEDLTGADEAERIRDLVKRFPYLASTEHDLNPWLKEARTCYKLAKESDTSENEHRKRAEDICDRIEVGVKNDETKLEVSFRMFTTDNKDWLGEEEVRKMLQTLGFPSTSKDVEDLVQLVDTDGDGKVKLPEFKAFVGRTGGIFKLIEIRRKELLERRMRGGENEQAAIEDFQNQLQLAGFESDECKAWSRVLPKSEFEETAALLGNQKRALAHIRGLAKYSHLKALPKLQKKVKELRFQEKDLWITLAFIRDLAPLIVHVNLDSLVDVLDGGDTHYRNQFETGSSGGCLSTNLRKKWENALFGCHYQEAAGAERVKYGVLNCLNDVNGVKACEQYGDSYLVLKNSRLRVTCAPEDSSVLKAERLAVLDYYAHVLVEYTDEELQETITAATSDMDTSGDSDKLSEYKEVQIHGDVEFAKHVSKLVANPRFKDTMQTRLENICKRNGMLLVWMDDEDAKLRKKQKAITKAQDLWNEKGAT